MKNSWHISRRHLLRGLGASLALPYLEVMGSSTNSQPPLRFACVFTPNGVFPKMWDVNGSGTDYQLSPILSPLQDHKQDLIVLKNLDNIGSGHVGLTSAFLTGVGVNQRRNGISLDQMVAQQYADKTRFPSIELGTEPPRQGGDGGQPIAYANTVSWATPTTRLSPEINPQVAFDRLFRNQDSLEARREANRRKSVIDLVLDDAKSLRLKASSSDQVKLDEYLDGVRTVEKQIDRSLNPPPREWEPLTTAPLERPPAGIPRERDLHLKLMMDIMVLAFQTDSTRVCTLMTAHGFSRQNFSFLDGVKSDHHGMSHHKNQAELTEEYTKVSTWYVSQFAYLLERMKQIDEGNGSLLDNSVLLYGSSMKDGNGHVRTNLPLVLAGKCGGAIQTGRHLVCPKGTPLASLHLTLAQKLGLELNDFNQATEKTITGLA